MEQDEEACVVEKQEVVVVAAEDEEDVEGVYADGVVVAAQGEGKGTVEEKNVGLEMEDHELKEEIVDVGDENQTVVAVVCQLLGAAVEQTPWQLHNQELVDP